MEETVLTTEEVDAWLENLLAENVAERGNLIPYKWTVHWNGWQLPRCFQPSSDLPLLADTLRLSMADPNFYFQNGPANTFGLHSHFGEKLAWMPELPLGTGMVGWLADIWASPLSSAAPRRSFLLSLNDISQPPLLESVASDGSFASSMVKLSVARPFR